MSTGDPRRIDVTGRMTIEAPGSSRIAELSLRIDQRADGRQTTGAFRLADPGAGVELEMAESGLVQTAPGWAAWSGMARVVPTGALRAVTVIVDGFPQSQERPDRTVVVSTGDGYRVSGVLR